jgi:DNA-binding CsgD family transcriptional regulator
VLSNVSPARVELARAEFMPQFLLPLVSALEQRQDAGATIVAIVRRLGFENFLYGASASPKLDQESRSYVYTTLSREWVAQYDQEAYIEVDPRLGRALDSALPLVWDYSSEYGHSPRRNRFFDESRVHGVGSGIVVGLHGPRGVRVIVALSNPSSRIDTIQRKAIADHLGEIVLFAIYFHEIFMKAVIERGIAPASHGAPLSPRELECLSLAAHGQTTKDMSLKLGISERTIQFHFDSIRSKLGAANRQEAIAKAISQGAIHR